MKGIEIAPVKDKAGSRCQACVALQVGGAFHSPLMEPAREELAKRSGHHISHLHPPSVYQNVNAPSIDDWLPPKNLIAQLTSPVRWTQSGADMVKGWGHAVCGMWSGKVLQGLVKRLSWCRGGGKLG